MDGFNRHWSGWTGSRSAHRTLVGRANSLMRRGLEKTTGQKYQSPRSVPTSGTLLPSKAIPGVSCQFRSKSLYGRKTKPLVLPQIADRNVSTPRPCIDYAADVERRCIRSLYQSLAFTASTSADVITQFQPIFLS